MEKPRGPTKMNEKELDAYLDRVRHLPPAPTLMIELIKLFCRSDADLGQIVDLLRQDPALTIEVLRRCNSGYSGMESPIMDMNEAVFRLGFNEVYQITVMLFSMRAMNVQKEAPNFPGEALRIHSGISAVAAGTLALDVGESEGIAFTAGLLHDVGKLVLALAERDKYVAVMEECRVKGIPLSAGEKNEFGFSHIEVGARLLNRWGVPIEVIAPALDHNTPIPEGDWQRYALITNLSSRLANYIQEGTTTPKFWELPEIDSLKASLELDQHQVQKWEQLVRKKIKQLPALLKG
jgi:putative nucleotidyltransferase with HDIG domain